LIWGLLLRYYGDKLKEERAVHMTNETLQSIKRRRSIRAYLPEQVKNEELQAVLEAGASAPYASAPSAHFTVIQNEPLLASLNAAAKEVARQSPLEHLRVLGSNEHFHCIYEAPTLIIISDHESAIVPEMCCAAAAQNILVAAESLGLGACWIYFVLQAFQSTQGDQLLQELKLPEGYHPQIAIAIGYRQASAVDVTDRNADAGRIAYIL
jgi:nitroreductase